MTALFDDIGELCNYVESIDVENGEYLVFDQSGRFWDLSAGVALVEASPGRMDTRSALGFMQRTLALKGLRRRMT